MGRIPKRVLPLLSPQTVDSQELPSATDNTLIDTDSRTSFVLLFTNW